MMPESPANENELGSNWATNPSTDFQQVLMEYETSAAQYEQLITRAEYRAPLDVGRLLRWYCGNLDDLILDAGCGTGLSGFALAQQGFRRLVGIDASPAMLKIAQEKEVYETLLAGNLLQRLPFDSAQFGAAVCVAVLGHIQSVEQMAIELCRVVKPGGCVIFTQRDDLFEEWKYDVQLRKLDEASIWSPVYKSESRPYLPGRAEYGTAVTVRYYVYTKI